MKLAPFLWYVPRAYEGSVVDGSYTLPSHPGIPFPYILGWAGGTDFLIAAIGLEQPFAGGKGVVCPGVLLTFGTLPPSVKTVTYNK